MDSYLSTSRLGFVFKATIIVVYAENPVCFIHILGGTPTWERGVVSFTAEQPQIA